jgi:cob(I)alamin adenosyltransferase
MGHRLSGIVTRTGDGGTTGLADGRRVPKDHARIEACGSVDELNCVIGLLLAQEPMPEEIASCLIEAQHELFDLGGELTAPHLGLIGSTQVQRLEAALEHLNADLPPLKEFVLPGGGSSAAAAHHARAVCRRVERRCWTLANEERVGAEVLRYLNRLSDLLFVIARVLARQRGGEEQLWRHERRPKDHDPS